MTSESSRTLEVENLTVQFGGLVAVDRVTLSVTVGQPVGLVGPNGAGKTTTFNCCSGLLRPTAGTITLFGHDVTSESPSNRARMGLGRTFQRMELYDRLTVRENVALGLEARQAGGSVLRSLFATKSDREAVQEATVKAIGQCGIEHLADRRAGELASGQRRLVELARALAGDYELLLLDEPSSGLDPTETEAFGQILSTVVHDEGRGILLVEHDMSLVRAVCDFTYVLDFGRLIAQGPTSEVLSSDIVKAAYLGKEGAA